MSEPRKRYWIDQRLDFIAVRDNCVSAMLGLTPGAHGWTSVDEDTPDVVWYEKAPIRGRWEEGVGWLRAPARERAEAAMKELEGIEMV